MQPKLLSITAVLALLLVACNGTEQTNGQAKSKQGEASSLKLDGIKELDSLIINEEEARGLADGYVAHLESTNDPEATKAVWFPKSVVTAFAKAFEENSNLDGIRIYFAKYGSSQPAEVQNKLTMFILGTMAQGERTHRDTFLFEKEGKFVTLGIKNFNHGELCPITCDGSFRYDENWK